ncbi:MAG: tail fiber protein [Chitinophagales bacterium]|nr:tail fiber protein [Chitinophagales bacterium]
MNPFIGLIVMFGGNFAPRGWALCDGQLLPINQYSALFSILGTTYGGDGRTTFALPDLRGRVAIHEGTGPGLSPYDLGQKGGSETVTLTTSQIPSHNHSFELGGTASSPAGSNSLVGNVTGGDTIFNPTKSGNTLSSGAIHNTGGGQSHNNIQPYLTVNFIIALQGTYPSRS